MAARQLLALSVSVVHVAAMTKVEYDDKRNITRTRRLRLEGTSWFILQEEEGDG
jgi:hypothetical protein